MDEARQPRFFRNRIEVDGVEPERLWMEDESGQLVLVDEDDFAIVGRSDDPRFYQIAITSQLRPQG